MVAQHYLDGAGAAPARVLASEYDISKYTVRVWAQKLKYNTPISKATLVNILKRNFYAENSNEKWVADVREFKIPNDKKKGNHQK